MKTLMRIDRLSAWVLFGSMFLYLVSGYGMTKGLIDQSLAAKLHLSVLTYFMLVSFVFHTAYAIRLAFIRWGVWNSWGKLLWALFYIIFILFFVFVDRFYRAKPLTASNNTSTVSSNENDASSRTASATQTPPTAITKVFNASELSKYDGRNGTPSYVAIDGLVYDLTGIFQNGYHFGHYAGRDLSNEFYSRHVKSSVSKYPVVGRYQN